MVVYVVVLHFRTPTDCFILGYGKYPIIVAVRVVKVLKNVFIIETSNKLMNKCRLFIH